MGQAAKEKPYSTQLSDNYMLKRKQKNKHAREKALKALNYNNGNNENEKQNAEQAGRVN
jgi:hypothetical protein